MPDAAYFRAQAELFAELARTLSDPNAIRRAQISANQRLQRALEWEQLQKATSRNSAEASTAKS